MLKCDLPHSVNIREWVDVKVFNISHLQTYMYVYIDNIYVYIFIYIYYRIYLVMKAARADGEKVGATDDGEADSSRVEGSSSC